MAKEILVTQVERMFPADRIIVSKTDRTGRILYANDLFIEMSGYTEPELLGQPHSILRHPDMPRCVFHLFWELLNEGEEVFAFVKNRCKNGDHYWVLAHVTPTLDSGGRCVGYHSTRYLPRRDSIETVTPIYGELVALEQRSGNRRDGMHAGSERLASVLQGQGMSYKEFIFNLT